MSRRTSEQAPDSSSRAELRLTPLESRYDHFSTRYDTSEKQRIPSWCDRVLWHIDKEDDVRCLFYRRYEADMSDHRPVGAAFVVRAYKINRLKQQEAHWNVLREWTNMEEGLILTARGYYPPLS